MAFADGAHPATSIVDRAPFRSSAAAFAGPFSREHIDNLPRDDGRLQGWLEIVIYRGSVDVFATGGRVALTGPTFPPRDAGRGAVFAGQDRRYSQGRR
ncbi:hypothetical protein [Burkholderia sp. JKS000303]|uniref:hypothetical protein n=1 Tax=Burkholderia sp. JKS000303 TaxID=1938747 RepID=UPI000BF4951B|nr:hypothetical protein [Burkholderia sp. JKS000303]PFH30033.1 hypothetical protein BX604_3819 [Burkholderia sp. JKS000303]